MEITYTTSAFDLDNDSVNDSFSFTLVVTPAGAATAATLVGNGQNRFGASPVGNANLQPTEALTFTIAAITTSAWGGDFTASYDFVAFGLNNFSAASEAATYQTTGSAQAATGGANLLPGSNETSLTITNTTPGDPINNGDNFLIEGLGFDITVIPEPSSAMLLGAVGVLGLLRRRR